MIAELLQLKSKFGSSQKEKWICTNLSHALSYKNWYLKMVIVLRRN